MAFCRKGQKSTSRVRFPKDPLVPQQCVKMKEPKTTLNSFNSIVRLSLNKKPANDASVADNNFHIPGEIIHPITQKVDEILKICLYRLIYHTFKHMW